MAYSLLNYSKFLAGKAQQKQLITFQEYADEFEIKTIRSTTSPLKKILRWSDSKGLPPLNVIVVTAENASEGHIQKDAEKQKAIDSVFEYPWKNIFWNLPEV